MAKGGKSPKNQTVTQSPYFKGQSAALANQVTADALNRSAYQGSTHAGLTGRQRQGIAQIGDLAAQGDPQLDQARSLNQSVLSGDFLGPNPHLSAALAPIREEFQRTIAPSIDAAAVGAGRTGSGRHALMRDTAEQSLADSMARVAYQNYDAERGRQQQALGLAPGLSQARFADSQAMINAEALKRADRQGVLDDRARRFYEERQAPLNALASVSGIGGSTTQPVYQGSRLSGAIGGGLSGAGTGAMLGSVIPGLGTGVGAAIGGGLGAFGGLLG